MIPLSSNIQSITEYYPSSDLSQGIFLSEFTALWSTMKTNRFSHSSKNRYTLAKGTGVNLG